MNDINLRAAGGNLLLGDLANPNKMPFSGILTYLGVPSDQPPGGSGGLRVLIPVEIGVSAVESLIGVPVNLAASMDDHDTDAVVGVIDDAHIGEPTDKGTPIHVSGHIFAKSFSDEAYAIKASQQTLGFSYETAKTRLEIGDYNGEKVAVATALVFTGAAILYKNAAAYQSTSLAAKGERDLEELMKQLLAEMAEIKAALAKPTEETKEEDAIVTASEDTTKEAEEEEEEETKEEEVEEKAEETEVTANSESNELASAVTALTDIVKSLKADIDELKAAATVEAAAEPVRRSLSALVSKFSDKAESTDVFASIDKRNLTTEQSMAEKLVAFTQAVKGE